MLLTAAQDSIMVKADCEPFLSEDDDLGYSGGSQEDAKLRMVDGGPPSSLSSQEDSGEETSSSGGCTEDAILSQSVERLSLGSGGDKREAKPQHEIREVWRHNLREEFNTICHLVQHFPFVAMDTEFPGVVVKPAGDYDSDEYRYQQVKLNVDLLKLIQLGITLFDSSGTLAQGVCTWQFNFEFNESEDPYALESITLLKNSGLEFDKHQSHGIPPHEFAELLYSSGLVLMDNVTWLTFHSAYDFGYLLSQLTQQTLPPTEAEFMKDLKLFFPHFYDIKYLMLFTDNLIGGLQNVANYLKVQRIGIQHQAGSDSLLTGQVFFRMYEEYFADGLDDVKYSGQIAGFKPTSGCLQKKGVENLLCSELEEFLPAKGIASPMRDH